MVALAAGIANATEPSYIGIGGLTDAQYVTLTKGLRSHAAELFGTRIPRFRKLTTVDGVQVMRVELVEAAAVEAKKTAAAAKKAAKKAEATQ